MAKHINKKPTPKQRQCMQYSEDYFQLLDTINKMIDLEFDRREAPKKGVLHLENSPPSAFETPSADTSSDSHSLWQRVVAFFMSCDNKSTKTKITSSK